MNSQRGAVLKVFEVLDRLEIPYVLGGSFASSVHGVARATQDIDVVADLPLAKVESLAAALAGEFYVDAESIRQAILRGAAFNLIHFGSGLKLDVFIARRHALGREQLQRRQDVLTGLLGGEPMEVPVITAEDVVLAKLSWYRDGGGVSERQWNDLMNVWRVQAGRMDKAYLDAQSERLGVRELLDRLRGS